MVANSINVSRLDAQDLLGVLYQHPDKTKELLKNPQARKVVNTALKSLDSKKETVRMSESDLKKFFTIANKRVKPQKKGLLAKIKEEGVISVINNFVGRHWLNAKIKRQKPHKLAQIIESHNKEIRSAEQTSSKNQKSLGKLVAGLDMLILKDEADLKDLNKDLRSIEKQLLNTINANNDKPSKALQQVIKKLKPRQKAIQSKMKDIAMRLPKRKEERARYNKMIASEKSSLERMKKSHQKIIADLGKLNPKVTKKTATGIKKRAAEAPEPRKRVAPKARKRRASDAEFRKTSKRAPSKATVAAWKKEAGIMTHAKKPKMVAKRKDGVSRARPTKKTFVS